MKNNIFSVEKQRLCLTNGVWKLQLDAWGRGIRVRTTIGECIIDSDFALIHASNADCIIEQKDDCYEMTTADIKAVVTLNGNISFFDNKNKLILTQDNDCHSRMFAEVNNSGVYQLEAVFDVDASEKIYGMGQYQSTDFNLKGTKYKPNVIELKQVNKQITIPYYISSLGYGFFWHNPSLGTASFGLDRNVWIADECDQLDYWVTCAETPYELVRNYTEVTGRAEVMPEKYYGLWQSRLRYWNQEQLLDVVREYKMRNISLDVIICDFFHYEYLGDFCFEEEFFPNAKAMVDEVKNHGVEFMISIWPQIDTQSKNYNEMKEKGYLAQKTTPLTKCFYGGKAQFYDATQKDARDYIWEKCKEGYYDIGIKSFWLDEVEPTMSMRNAEDFDFKESSYTKVANLYPQLVARNFYEGLKENSDDEVVSLIRCAWAGSQRYGSLVWSGDIGSNFTDFAKQVVAGQHIGIAGIPWWNTDIGGFMYGNPKSPQFRELLLRWFEWATFTPCLRLHGNRIPNKPVNRKSGRACLHTGAENEIWSYGKRAEKIMKKFLHFRLLMKPYIKKLMEEASETGAPLIRSMFFEFPNDEKCWEISDQHMFGDNILVAPILTRHAKMRRVYLPSGANWTDIRSGQKYEGGRVIISSAPICSIPVFVKDNTLTELVGKL